MSSTLNLCFIYIFSQVVVTMLEVAGINGRLVHLGAFSIFITGICSTFVQQPIQNIFVKKNDRRNG